MDGVVYEVSRFGGMMVFCFWEFWRCCLFINVLCFRDKVRWWDG